MGLFNTLTTEITCPNCNEKFQGRFQFKFGSTCLLEYKIRDTLSWGKYDIGHPGITKVKAYGVIEGDEKCPICAGRLSEHYDIFIEKDVIVGISPIRDMSEYLKGNGEFVVID